MAKGMIVKLRRSEWDMVLNLVVTEDSKVDVGTIAESLGLNPVSLQFNGLYISPGHDFISSVTWKTLLNYFTNNGYSPNDPIHVDGTPPRSPQFQENGSRVNGNHSNDVNCSNSEEIRPGSKRKAWLEDSAVCSVLKRCKNVQDTMDVNASELGPNPLANNKHFHDFGAEYVNCYSKRGGRREDFKEMHPEKKHSRFQYDLDVHSKTYTEKQKQQFWNGGNFPSAICNTGMKKRFRNDMLPASLCKRAR